MPTLASATFKSLDSSYKKIVAQLNDGRAFTAPPKGVYKVLAGHLALEPRPWEGL